jgi:hypothetical protein
MTDDTPRVVGVANPDDWMERAACRSIGNDLFFATTQPDIDAAKQVCADCLTRARCLEVALAEEINMDGIWGGLTFDERAILRRQRPGHRATWAVELPREHGTERGYQQHRRYEPPCAACKDAHYQHYLAQQARKAA